MNKYNEIIAISLDLPTRPKMTLSHFRTFEVGTRIQLMFRAEKMTTLTEEFEPQPSVSGFHFLTCYYWSLEII